MALLLVPSAFNISNLYRKRAYKEMAVAERRCSQLNSEIMKDQKDNNPENEDKAPLSARVPDQLQDPTEAERLENEHRIPNADPPKNEHQRGGFGIRMGGQEGYGSDSANGVTSLSTNEPDSDEDINRGRVEE